MIKNKNALASALAGIFAIIVVLLVLGVIVWLIRG